ncbi:ESPR-type extended signal peptide-containing protein [Escherichia coli]|nr:hypothetical protein [Escherichia coli]HEL6073225.1 hypothetical protein [Escherichia coli]HEL6208290.1 hypothetical protein [Escherichia coli]
MNRIYRVIWNCTLQAFQVLAVKRWSMTAS